MTLRVGSLFAGIGGFDLAADRAGMEVVFQSEIDRHASAVLDYHWPHVKNLGDIHGITDAPRVDVLTGGFPCQDYSVAGLRGGLVGDRGALWWEYHRLILELRPTWIVGENVPGLLSSRGGADFETIVGSLTECGYGVAWAVLDAQYFGVAQRRHRVFIVGHIGGEPRPEVLALDEGLFGHSPPRRETGEGAAPTLAALTRGGGGLGTDFDLDGGLVPALTRSGPMAYDDQGTGHLVPAMAHTLTQGAPSAGRRQEDDHNLVAFAQNQRDEIRELDQAGSLNAERWGTNKGETLLATLQEVGARESKNQNGIGIGIADPSKSFTLQAGQQHGIATTSSVRRLTPLECERLQGFPDGWTDIPGNSDTQRYRQLGNAVAVSVVEWLLKRISGFEEVTV